MGGVGRVDKGVWGLWVVWVGWKCGGGGVWVGRVDEGVGVLWVGREDEGSGGRAEFSLDWSGVWGR